MGIISDYQVREIIKYCLKTCGCEKLPVKWNWFDVLENDALGHAEFQWEKPGKVKICEIMISRYELIKSDISTQIITITHEICHLISWFFYGTQIEEHGIEWQNMMKKCGISEPEAYYYENKELLYAN